MVENDLNYDKMLQLFSMPPLLDQWKAIAVNMEAKQLLMAEMKIKQFGNASKLRDEVL